jgi:hypothetical protein
MISVHRFNLHILHMSAYDRHFQSVNYPIRQDVLDQLTDRPESHILRAYMHHADESDGHNGTYAPMAQEIQEDIDYLRNMEAGQKISIGALAIAYNYIIMEDGIVWSLRPATKVPASQIGDNENGISVCFDGTFMTKGLNKVQLAVGKDFFKYLVQRYKIKSPNIFGHCDVAKRYPNNEAFYATACPGTYAYAHDLPLIREYAFS